MIGRTISHYRVFEKLGEGGMGVVYKAEDTRLDRLVALKFLALRLLPGDENRKRFVREAKAAAALNHQNICTVYEIDEVDERVFIAMAYIEGESLDKKIERGPLKLEEAFDIARQITDGLEEAHGLGVVHRDIKPGNVMLTPKGDGQVRVTIMDFGLAQLAGHSKITRNEAAIGTVAYMSPEQTYGDDIDHRSDVWALGVVLYEMIAGKMPFRGEHDAVLMYAIANEEPEPITGVRAGLPIELDWIIGKAIEKEPAARFQHVAELGVDLGSLLKKLRSSSTSRRPLGSTTRRQRPPAGGGLRALLNRPAIIAAAVLMALVAGFLVGTWGDAPPQAPGSYSSVIQLTYDSGLTYQPAISPDGSLIAFASDRSEDGNLDIWLKHLGGGEPIRLSDHPADDSQPSFSPDGGRIAFRSERDGGGVYTIPVLGGEARLAAANGRRPRISPSGNWIAYWVGQSSSSFTGGIYVVDLKGGEPRRLREEFALTRAPVWLPSGDRLLFAGIDDEGVHGWWTTSLDDGPAVQVRFDDWPFPGRFPNLPYPESVDNKGVLIANGLGTSVNVWRVPLSADGSSAGRPEQVTVGSAREDDPASASADQLVFSSLIRNINLWSFPLDAERGRMTGPAQRLSNRASKDFFPSLSANGRLLAFESNRAGNRDVWIKDLETGHETAVTNAASMEAFPLISPDGSKAAYRQVKDGVMGVGVRDIEQATTRTVCEECTGPYGWLPDGSKLLVRLLGDTKSLTAFDVGDGKLTTVLRHPSFVLYEARFSPDGGWIGFHSLNTPTTRQMFAAPFRGDVEVPHKEWIPIGDGTGMDRNFAWSPDGGMAYFLSERDGFRCIWAQKLDPATKRPIGDAFNVAHFHSAHQSMVVTGFTIAVGKDSLVLALTDLTGNVWMIEP